MDFYNRFECVCKVTHVGFDCRALLQKTRILALWYYKTVTEILDMISSPCSHTRLIWARVNGSERLWEDALACRRSSHRKPRLPLERRPDLHPATRFREARDGCRWPAREYREPPRERVRWLKRLRQRTASVNFG